MGGSEAAGRGPWGSEEEFLAFHQATARGLWSYLFYLGRDRALADDLSQESYLRLLRAAEGLEAGAGLTGYLYRIAGNVFVDHCRRRSRERSQAAEHPLAEGDLDGRTGCGAAARAMQSRVECEDVLSRLQARERELLWLAYGEGAPHRDIALRMGLGEKSVKVLLHRARRRLAALIGRGRSES
jgi:RNA polymerase sigma-70 factor, ECF subfamily